MEKTQYLNKTFLSGCFFQGIEITVRTNCFISLHLLYDIYLRKFQAIEARTKPCIGDIPPVVKNQSLPQPQCELMFVSLSIHTSR